MHFSAGNAYLRLPEPLRDCAQWVLADPRPHPTLYKEPYYVVNGTLRKADVNLPQTWHTFEEACAHAQTHNMLLGYVLKCGEGVTCIDLDFKDSNSHPDQPEVWTTQEQLNRYNVIIQHFDSYTERSRSGRGVHIWVLGEIGSGVKYDGVEVYSQSRYIICTANAIIQKEAVYRQELLDVLVSEMRVHSHSTGKVALVELEQTESDEAIISRATSAENKDKFLKLANGNWQGDYASQSEADYAFMSMLTFYSKSNEQCRRLFRLSALGKRDKATRNDRYLNECLINIRSREAVEQEQQEVIRNTAKHVSANIVQNLVRRAEEQKARGVNTPQPAPPVQAVAEIIAPPPVVGGLEWPPGIVGRVAYFFYCNSARPVKDIAIVSAIGFMSGICGGAWSISRTGCNLYTVLLALSGVGKEGLHTGISALCAAVGLRTPHVYNFVSLNRARSSVALRKDLEEKPWQVNIIGEIGKVLQSMSNKNKSPTMEELAGMWTEIYMKSGPNMRVAGLTYSDRTKNVAESANVAYSLLGESTPVTYYMALSDSMLEDGFASRILAYEYEGERVALNKSPLQQPDNALADAIAAMVNQAKYAQDNQLNCTVGLTKEAENISDEFEARSTQEINNSLSNAQRQIWNRAHLKVLKVAALLAIGKNYANPVIEKEHINWAVTFVMANVTQVLNKINNGELGDSDASRLLAIKQIIIRYFATPTNDRAYSNGLISRSTIQNLAIKRACFSTHPRGTNYAIADAIKTLLDEGFIVQEDKITVAKLALHGSFYRIVSYN